MWMSQFAMQCDLLSCGTMREISLLLHGGKSAECGCESIAVALCAISLPNQQECLFTPRIPLRNRPSCRPTDLQFLWVEKGQVPFTAQQDEEPRLRWHSWCQPTRQLVHAFYWRPVPQLQNHNIRLCAMRVRVSSNANENWNLATRGTNCLVGWLVSERKKLRNV